MLDEHVFQEHRDLQRTLQDVLRRSLVPLSERDAPAARSASAAELRKHLGDVGVWGIGIGESQGGVGGGMAELAVIARELGRVLAPTSIVTAAVCVELLRAADDRSCEDVLWELASGRRAAVALPQPGWAPWGRPLAQLEKRRARNGDVTVSGQLTGVVDADDASWLLILVSEPGTGDSPSILVIDAHHGGIGVDGTNETGVIRSFSTLSLDAVPVRVSRPRPGTVRLASAEGCLLLAYEMLGASEAVIRVAAEHAATREQFGRPIGTFQAVSHRLAAVYIELQAAAASACYALRCHGTPVFALSASMARETGARCLTAACESAMQVLGAIGFTWEHPLHHYLKYAKTCDRLLVPGRGIEAEITAVMEGDG